MSEIIKPIITDETGKAIVEAIIGTSDQKQRVDEIDTKTKDLQSQIDNIISPVTEDAEVQNLRIGIDGKSYPTAKSRVDAEITGVKKDLSEICETGQYKKHKSASWQQGRFMTHDNVVEFNTSSAFCHSDYIDISDIPAENTEIHVVAPEGLQVFVTAFKKNDDTYDNYWNFGADWATEQIGVKIPNFSTYKYLLINVMKDGSHAINTNEAASVEIYTSVKSKTQSDVDGLSTILNVGLSALDKTTKGISEDISAINSELIEVGEGTTFRKYKIGTWVEGRYTASNNVVSFNSDADFCNSGYIDISDIPAENTEIYIIAPNGFKVYATAFKTNDFTYDNRWNLSSDWGNEIVGIKQPIFSVYSYLCINIMKDSSTTISVEDAKQVKIFWKKKISTQIELDQVHQNLQEDEVVLESVKEIVNDRLTEYIDIENGFNQGRISASGNYIVKTDSNNFCYMYVDMNEIESLKIKVSDKFKMFAWYVENDTESLATLAPKPWDKGWLTYDTATVEKNAEYRFLAMSLTKVNSGIFTPDDILDEIELSKNNVNSLKAKIDKIKEQISAIDSNTFIPFATSGQVLYTADTKATSNHIVNAVAYNDGTIIACRSNGKVVRIGYDGTETEVLSLNGTGMDWRGVWMDSNENVFVSPHASWGSLTMSERGIYKLTKGANSFVKVLSFDNTTEHDDTIWTFCEDDKGYLYAGVYCHTKRFQPRIYRSINGGSTWSVVVDFTSSSVISGGHHIHSVIYSPYKKALYAIVGEINTILKSTDHGVTWQNLHVALTVKGTAMYPTPYGIIIGSDGAYNCDMDILYNDDTTHEKVFRGWANTVFATRCSDLTGFIYAFTKIDSSVNSLDYYPPVTALTDESAIETWRATHAGAYTNWKAYHDSIVNEYPDDAIRPQHYSILVSRDGGKHWEVLKKFSCSSTRASGFWTTGYFKNGECLTGLYNDNGIVNPIVISEGKHKYTNGGCEFDGEIFIRTNSSTIAELI